MIRSRIACVVAAFCCFGAARVSAQEPHEGAEFQLRRQAWFDDQRAYPAREVNWEAMLRTRQEFTSRLGVHALSAFSTAATSWSSMGPAGFFGVGYWDSGPQLDAGRIDAIALHPTNPAKLFVASPRGGLWGTALGGASWNPLFDSQCTLQMSTVKIDPTDPSIMYAGAANASGAAGCALFRSLDGGASWNNWNGNLNFTAYGGGNILELFIDPVSAGTTAGTTLIFSQGTNGIYRSTNSGASWVRPATLNSGYVTSIVSLPGKPGVIFAGVADYLTPTSLNTGVYRSSDNGATWTKILSGGGYTSVGRLQLATSQAAPNSVWVLAGTKTSAFGLLARWDDVQGEATTLTADGIDLSDAGRTHFGTQATYDLAIAIDPADSSRVYIAGVRAFRSTNGGRFFFPMATEIHCDWHTIVIDPRSPRRLYAGTDGGIFTSTDGGDRWTSLNAGLVVSMYYPGIAQHPTDPDIIIGGLQDNGTLMSNVTSWYSSVGGGDGGFAAINFASPGTIWSTCQWSSAGPCVSRRVTVAGGFSRPIVTNGITTTDRAQFIPPLVMDPVAPTTLYFGTMRLYRTVNDGLLWTPISEDLSKGSGTIKAVAIAASDTKTIYVGTSDGNVQVTRTGGASWTLSTAGLPSRTVTDFAVDRSNPARAVVTMSGSGASHVFLTSDAGVTWTSIGAGLPDMPTNAVVIIDNDPNHFFVGTDIGVFETLDAGVTWANTPAGLPNVIVNDLSYNPNTRQLVAATYGRGLFKYTLTTPLAVLRGDVNRDGAVTALDALLIRQSLIGQPLPAGLTIFPEGDADCNGKIDAYDALLVLMHAVGVSSGACVNTKR